MVLPASHQATANRIKSYPDVVLAENVSHPHVGMGGGGNRQQNNG